MSRRIAVLGGAGGIGRAIVSALAETGDEVLVLDLPASLERHPPAVKAVGIDVHSEQAIAVAVRELSGHWRSVDGYVQLAGYNPRIQTL